jgi:ATP-binding cassette subfamily B protein
MIQLFIPLNFLGFVYREIRRSLTDIENMLALLKRPAKILDAPAAQELKVSKGNIVWREVDFAYNPERQILHKLNTCL